MRTAASNASLLVPLVPFQGPQWEGNRDAWHPLEAEKQPRFDQEGCKREETGKALPPRHQEGQQKEDQAVELLMREGQGASTLQLLQTRRQQQQPGCADGAHLLFRREHADRAARWHDARLHVW